MAEARLLAAARGGDERAFARVTSPYRRVAAYFDRQAYGLMVFEVAGGRIAEIVGFADAARIYDRFGLPERFEDLT
jgi:ketosteroid isomerase-like protein